MKKVSKAIKAFIAILKKPYLLNAVLNSEELLETEFQGLFPSANEKKQISFSTLFPLEKDENVYPYSFLSGSSLATDFALLKLLCKKIEAEDYFEIGTWRGESVANVAPYVKNCFTLNLSDEVMLQKGLDKSYIQMHRFYSKDIINGKYISKFHKDILQISIETKLPLVIRTKKDYNNVNDYDKFYILTLKNIEKNFNVKILDRENSSLNELLSGSLCCISYPTNKNKCLCYVTYSSY
jgi:hypothetical protein